MPSGSPNGLAHRSRAALAEKGEVADLGAKGR